MIRLQKYLAECGVASRRSAEKLIQEGAVSVNGLVVTELGTKVDEQNDRVLVNGRPVRPEAEKDSRLSSKWHSLFMWSILGGVLVGFGSVSTVLIATLSGMNAVKITALVVGLLGIPQMILDVVYITYLKKKINILSEGIEGVSL